MNCDQKRHSGVCLGHFPRHSGTALVHLRDASPSVHPDVWNSKCALQSGCNRVFRRPLLEYIRWNVSYRPILAFWKPERIRDEQVLPRARRRRAPRRDQPARPASPRETKRNQEKSKKKGRFSFFLFLFFFLSQNLRKGKKKKKLQVRWAGSHPGSSSAKTTPSAASRDAFAILFNFESG